MTMHSRGTVLFVHNRDTRFVAIDRAILMERWKVTDWYQRSRVINVPALWKSIRKSSIVVGWFASWHTLLPMELARIARVPSLLIVGGYDVASRSDIRYGHGGRLFAGWVSRRTIRSAGTVTTISDFSLAELRNFARGFKCPVKVIPLGVPDPWDGQMPPKPEKRIVLSVGNVNTENVQRKGHGPFALASRDIADAQFALVGRWEDGTHARLQQMAGGRLTLTGYASDDQLNNWYRQASVYVQLSEHEGFGMALAEAMLAGCMPVVARNGALPEVVGAAGIYVNPRDRAAVADGIRRALGATEVDRQKARDQIVRNFPVERRAQALLDLVETSAQRRLG